jgi:hypothetical protein
MTADLMNVVTHSTVEITEELNKAPVVLAGMITDVRQITTKKGDTMAFVRLEDLQGNVDVTVFPQLYKDTRSLWVVDKIVIVQGKVDLRNGRVSVLADSVRDYVQGTNVVEDISSVAYRFRNGGLLAQPQAQAAAPALREQPTLKDFAARYALPPTASPAESFREAEEAEVAYFGVENPFAAEEPEWLDTESRWAGEQGSKGAGEQQVRPAAAAVAPASTGPCTVKIAFRRSQSLDADRKRLAELVDVLSKYAGEDRFEIVVEASGGVRYQFDFPNNRTRICRELRAELTQRLGTGGWKVEG